VEVVEGHHDAGRAVAALEAVRVEDRLLGGVEPLAVRDALDGGDAPAVRLYGEGETRADKSSALERVVELGGHVVHPGERWAICKDSEGSPFGLSR
jgi:hypothetical protein